MSGTRDQGNILGTMPVDRLVLTMSAPIMVSMLVSAVYNLVDSIYVAQVSDLDFLALSYAYPVQLMMVAFCTGIGVGFNATFAQRLGEGKGEEANRVACHGFLFYTLCWLLFLAFALFGASADAREKCQRNAEYQSTWTADNKKCQRSINPVIPVSGNQRRDDSSGKRQEYDERSIYF